MNLSTVRRRKMPNTQSVKIHQVNRGRSYAVTIPIHIVKELGLRKGSRLTVERKTDKIVMKAI